MITENPKTSFLRNDFRIESLNEIITGLESSINSLKKRTEEESWYDGIWLLEETEPIYGLVFIAFQNYINGSIKDFSEKTIDKTVYYKIESNVNGFSKTKIELIIGLANYIKHKDEQELHKGTREILESFGMNLSIDIEVEKSPIYLGLSILDEKWNLFAIRDSVKNWREKLWTTQI